MSWSVYTNIVPKSSAEVALRDLPLAGQGVPEPYSEDQLEAAKRGALEILKSIPGPFVSISLAGHGNGIGWNKKDGYSNDFITVSISQHTDE